MSKRNRYRKLPTVATSFDDEHFVLREVQKFHPDRLQALRIAVHARNDLASHELTVDSNICDTSAIELRIRCYDRQIEWIDLRLGVLEEQRFLREERRRMGPDPAKLARMRDFHAQFYQLVQTRRVLSKELFIQLTKEAAQRVRDAGGSAPEMIDV